MELAPSKAKVDEVKQAKIAKLLSIQQMRNAFSCIKRAVWGCSNNYR